MPMQFDVSWDPISGAMEYTVTATPTNTGFNVQTSTGVTTTQTVINLAPGQIYNVTVSATYQTGTGPESEIVTQQTGQW